MKRIIYAFAALLIVAGITNCTRVGPGNVGIQVSMAGSNRGVEDIPLRTGWCWYNPMGSSIIEYPTFVQSVAWTRAFDEGKDADESITFNSKDGLIFNADVNLSYHLDGNKVPAFYLKYKKDHLEDFTDGLMRQLARDEFNNVAATMTAEEVYSTRKEELCKSVMARLNSEFQPVGLIVESVGFIGAVRAPQPFIDAVNSKLTATQKAQQAQNELAQTEAQAKKDVAYAQGQASAKIAQAEGEAKANQLLAQSLSPALLQWRQLSIQEQAVYRWNGQRPQVEGNGSGLLLQVGK